MIHLSCGRVLFAAFVLLCFSIAAVYMANKVEYIKRKKKKKKKKQDEDIMVCPIT